MKYIWRHLIKTLSNNHGFWEFLANPNFWQAVGNIVGAGSSIYSASQSGKGGEEDGGRGVNSSAAGAIRYYPAGTEIRPYGPTTGGQMSSPELDQIARLRALLEQQRSGDPLTSLLARFMPMGGNLRGQSFIDPASYGGKSIPGAMY